MTTVQSRKAKGRRLQQEIVKLLLEIFPDLTENDLVSVPASVNGPDVMMSEKARQLIPFDIECKNQEKIRLYEWWKQAKSNTQPGRQPLLVVHKNRHDTLFIISKETFINLLMLIANGDDRNENSM